MDMITHIFIPKKKKHIDSNARLEKIEEQTSLNYYT